MSTPRVNGSWRGLLAGGLLALLGQRDTSEGKLW
jgi:hypothetical protein